MVVGILTAISRRRDFCVGLDQPGLHFANRLPDGPVGQGMRHRGPVPRGTVSLSLILVQETTGSDGHTVLNVVETVGVGSDGHRGTAPLTVNGNPYQRD